MTNNKNYSLHTVQSDEGDFFHCVFEEQTQQAYDFFYFLDDALDCIKFLENGGAFAGFTPAFMLKEINRDINSGELNEKINDLFAD